MGIMVKQMGGLAIMECMIGQGIFGRYKGAKIFPPKKLDKCHLEEGVLAIFGGLTKRPAII
jgi:hypothetical protein